MTGCVFIHSTDFLMFAPPFGIGLPPNDHSIICTTITNKISLHTIRIGRIYKSSIANLPRNNMPIFIKREAVNSGVRGPNPLGDRFYS